MARTGRPPTDNPRTNAVHIRFTDDELAKITAAADTAGQPAGRWMRERLVAAAKRVKR